MYLSSQKHSIQLMVLSKNSVRNAIYVLTNGKIQQCTNKTTLHYKIVKKQQRITRQKTNYKFTQWHLRENFQSVFQSNLFVGYIIDTPVHVSSKGREFQKRVHIFLYNLTWGGANTSLVVLIWWSGEIVVYFWKYTKQMFTSR